MILLLEKKKKVLSSWKHGFGFWPSHKTVSCQFNFTYTAEMKDVSIGQSIKIGQDVRANKATEDWAKQHQ